MSTVQIKSKEQIEKEVRKENPDWEDKKVKMQVGRIFKQQETKIAEETKLNEITSEVRAEIPNLEGKALEKEVQARLKRQEDQTKLVEANKTVIDARDAYEKAISDYTTLKIKLDSKSGKTTSTLPKDVQDLIKKAQSISL